MPIDVLHSDIQEVLRETSPLLSSVQLANTITYYGTKYTVGMILSYGSTGGLPDIVELQDEFRRITTVHLESKFMSKLDEYTPKLLVLFHSKGEALGLRLQAILLKSEEGEADLKKPHSTKGKFRIVKSVRLHAAAPVRKLRETSLDMTLEETARSPFCEATLRFELHAHGFPLHPVRVAVLHADDHDTDSDRPDMLYWSYLLEAETEDRSHQETGQAR
ncbi:hypothetical protein AOLI_G00241810 [Acnodon oligacanthus]